MRILISGAGITGPTLAYWLAYYGFKPTLIEASPRLKTGGYIIDFWGAGFDIADRMGLLPEINRKGYKVKEVRIVSRNGKRVTGFSADAFRRMTNGGYVSLPRGDLVHRSSVRSTARSKRCSATAWRTLNRQDKAFR
jgi:2-polyprenyl-6-methoxyphenol hydroxylase-like FAD-dependent oxidoreductase